MPCDNEESVTPESASIKARPATVAYALIAVAGGAGLARPARAAADPLHWAAATVLNPLTVVYFGALVLSRQASGALTAGQAGIFVLCVFAASASWQLLPVNGGRLLGRLAGSPHGALAAALVSSALIMLLAQQAPLGVQATLASARAGLGRGPDAAHGCIASLLPGITRSQDAAEGLRSFTERREARCTGH